MDLKHISLSLDVNMWRTATREALSPPRARVGKAQDYSSVLQTVLVKIVTDIHFWQCVFGRALCTLDHLLVADHRPTH